MSGSLSALAVELSAYNQPKYMLKREGAPEPKRPTEPAASCIQSTRSNPPRKFLQSRQRLNPTLDRTVQSKSGFDILVCVPALAIRRTIFNLRVECGEGLI